MNRILIFCPTRSRNSNHQRLAKSFLATNPQCTTLVFSLDSDDQQTYQRIDDPRIQYMIEEPARFAPILNRMASFYERTQPNVEIMGWLGDDCIFRTHGWEDQVLEAYNDGAMVVAPSDGMRDSRFPNHYFVAAKVVRELGYITPPELEHLYCDNFLWDIGHALGRYRYLPLVLIEHKHYLADESLNDAQYKKANSEAQHKRDSDAYSRYCDNHFQLDVARLKKTLSISTTIEPVKFAVVGRKLRVMIVTPFYHLASNYNYLRSVMTELAVLSNAGCLVHFQPVMKPVCGDVIQRQRNRLTHYARKHEFNPDVMVWIDSDMGFSGEDVLRQLASGLPVVGLNAPRRNYYFDGHSNGEFQTGDDLRSALLRGTIQPIIGREAEERRCMREVLYVGTGVMVVWMNVIQKIIDSGLCKRLRFDVENINGNLASDDYWQIFWFPVTTADHVFGEGVELGEDQNFCDLTRAVGFKVWCDPRAGASHCGLHEFVGRPRWHEEMEQHYIPKKPTTTKE